MSQALNEVREQAMQISGETAQQKEETITAKAVRNVLGVYNKQQGL